jgi:hypothetical protein
VSTMLRYQFIVRREQFWLPAALAGLFGAVVAILAGHPYQAKTAASLLAFVFPLAGGILAASAVVEDPTLELQLVAPRAPWRALAECSVIIVGVVAVGSLAYQGWLAVLGLDIADYGGLLTRQLIWLAPLVALVALANATAALTAQGTLAALVVGGVWLFEIVARDWLASGDVGRKLLIFVGAVDPGASDLGLSYASVFALSAALLVLAGWLLRRTERYL